MAKKLLIVHGYSDHSSSFTGRTSNFTGLADFFIATGRYKKENIYFADYSSMDDDATFRDFADKLNDDFEDFSPDYQPVDVACHSTGALVTRGWLALHYLRNQYHDMNRPCPVRHLLMFAPANFGSDLAALGQSFLGKARATFFNSASHRKDFMESGREVLQGLEPASPFQWELSHYDLHGEHGAYFNPANDDQHRCFPFVFAAGEYYTNIEAYLLAKRSKPGTDGTVRICGTSLNTRKCRFSFRGKTPIEWVENNRKYTNIPFAVFKGFNHGNIINARGKSFTGTDRPGDLAQRALAIETLADYHAFAEELKTISAANYQAMAGDYAIPYQQFFFKVRDDVDQPVRDYYIDFKVQNKNGTDNMPLTVEFDEKFEASFYRHSADPSCRAMLINCRQLRHFKKKLDQAKARLVFDIAAKSHLPDVDYQPGLYIIYDGNRPGDEAETTFIYPNTTTLVDIILNRIQTDKLLNVAGYEKIVQPK